MKSSGEFHGTERFQLLGRLGSGGMGTVFEVYDRQRDRRLALKTLHRFSPASLLRFKAEFRALHEIRHHNLVRLEEVFETDGRWWFTMELVRGQEFLAYVRHRPPRHSPVAAGGSEQPTQEYPLASANTRTRGAKAAAAPRPSQPWCDMARLRSALDQLARGIAAIHAAGKLHRDIKPSNMLVTATGRLVILDFGLVAESSPGVAASLEEAAGTLAYMAPERITGQELGTAADWYSVGVILYEALCGKLPWADRQARIRAAQRAQAAPPPGDFVSGCADDLNALAVALLEPRPQARAGAQEILRMVGDAPPRTAPGHSSPPPVSLGERPFVGRRAELEFLDQAQAECSGVRPCVIVIDGPSGIGKSELIRHFGQRLRQKLPNAVLLSGRCYEREAVPYKALDGVIDALTRYLSELSAATVAALLPPEIGLLARVFPVLRQVPGIASAPATADLRIDLREMRQRVFQILRQLLSGLSLRHPVVLAIDDFHWADADSCALLRELLHPRGAPTLLLLLTVRTGFLDETALRDIGGRNAGFLRLPLAELGRADARELIGLLGPSLSPAECGSIVAETRGHPLLLLEMIRHGIRHGTLPGPLRLDDVLWTRVQELDPASRVLLEALTVAGGPLPQEAARVAAALPRPEFDHALAILREAHLCSSSGTGKEDAIDTYHDRVRAPLLFRLDAEAQQQLHHRIADALIATGVASRAPQTALPHLIAADRFVAATECARLAAEQALEAMAFEQEAELLRAALNLLAKQTSTAAKAHDGAATPTLDTARRDTRIQLGRALINAGRGREAAEAYLLAAKDAPPELQMECQRIAGEEFLISGYVTRGVATLNQVLVKLGESIPPTPQRAGLSILKNQLILRLRGLRWTARPKREIPRSRLAHLDTLKAVATGFGVVDSIRGLDYQTRCLRLALQLGEESRIARAMLREAMYASTRGRPGQARARTLIERSRVLVARAESPFLVAWTQVAEGFLAYFSGRFLQAAEICSQAETAIRETCAGHNWELSSARLFLLFSLRHAGEFKRLRVLFDDYLRDALRRGDLYTATTLNVAAGSVRFLDDDREAIRRELRNMRWSPREAGFHVQHFYELRLRGELALYEGQARVALETLDARFRQLAHSLLPRIQMVRVEALHLRGRLLLAAADPPPAGGRRGSRELHRIIRRLRRERVGYAALYAQLLSAAAALQRGRTTAAMSSLEEAISSAHDNDMRLHLAAAQRRLGALRGGANGHQLIANSDRWLRQEGVRDPERLLEVAAPGFHGAPGATLP
jgi:serine/threonine protein kinase